MSKIGNWVMDMAEREMFATGTECFNSGDPANPPSDLAHEEKCAFHLGWSTARNDCFGDQEVA